MYRNILPLLPFILLFCFHFSCKQGSEKIGNDAPQPDRDIGGLKTTRGLILKSQQASPGYVLFNTLASRTTYLINLDGEVVHQWESKYGPSGGFYLTDDGHLIRSGRDPYAPVFGGGGQGGYFQKFDWDGNLLWEYRFATEDHLSHHDMAIMPNGNILAIAWEAKSFEEVIDAGRKPDMIPEAGLWPDKVVEIKPEGKDGGKIVWEWHLWDHLIQNFDSTKNNYGDPSKHPELIDINLGRPLRAPPTKEELDKERAENNAVTNATPENRGSDLFHTNAIDYNAKLDQIVLSSPSKGEIFVIDHSTTTEEASGHTGGKRGKGGDFLYRWGNPENYGQGDSTNHRLGGQHDVRWVPEGMPGSGNLVVFNNSVPNAKPPYSAIYEFTPPIDPNGNYIRDIDKAFGPAQPIWTYIAKDTFSFWSPFISGVHRMANGNTFITEGAKGRYFEVNPAGEILWDYLTPFTDDVKMPDGTSPQPIGNLIYATFRASHFPADHPVLAGKELNPLDPQPKKFVPAPPPLQ